MRIERVDLYERFAVPRVAAGGGWLTAYLPHVPDHVSANRRRPAALILPGGGYEHLSERESEPVALRFAARGWAALVLEYAVAPARFPTALREAAMAMAFIREKGGDLGVDPRKVAAMGFSAGGHLCGCLGTMFDAPEVADIAPGAAIRPDALGLCYPVAVSWGRTHAGSFANLTGGDAGLAERLSLDQRARPDMPPAYLWCTRDDGSVPCRNTLLLAGAMEEVGVDFALHIYRHGKHGLSLADETVYPTYDMPSFSPDVPGWVDEMLLFFAQSGLRMEDER